jgi:hypothetical protein
VIRWLSARGILLGTVETAALPALMATTSADAEPGGLYGPSGPGHLGGRPAEQRLYRPLRNAADATRIWELSEHLARVTLPAV